MSYFVKSFDHMAAISQMIAESVGGLIFIYPVIYFLFTSQVLYLKKSKLLWGWHFPGLIFAAIVHVYTLIILADFYENFDYFPHQSAELMPLVYYAAAIFGCLIAQLLMVICFSKRLKKEVVLAKPDNVVMSDITSIELKGSHLEVDHPMDNKESKISIFQRLAKWYSSRSSRQRNILRLAAFLLSAAPFVGWFFIAPWMIPLMFYLEYHLKPLE